MRFFTLIVFLLCVTAKGNPRVAPPSLPIYLASEQLVVTISPVDARVEGTFRYQHPAYLKQSEKSANVSLELPVWFPEQSEDPSIEKFWKDFKEGYNRITVGKGEVLDRVLSLRIFIGKDQIRVHDFEVLPKNDLKNRKIPQEFHEPGFRCLLFRFGDSVIRHGSPVTISYRQPHSSSNGENRFFYLPAFDNLPKGISTADTNRYSVKFAVTAGCMLTFTNGEQKSMVEAGGSVMLSPIHHQAIRGIVRPQPNKVKTQ